MEVWSLDVTSNESINEIVAKVRKPTGGCLDFSGQKCGRWSVFAIYLA